ncbi:MAG: hypothetical protein CMM50_17665 [Rhodospirillaceae bacterium]|nr:hypothetical protein [Rhodospirillaceae bacterium]|tara:strand:- start:718 stop:951 length:234 start_codon:yes stop_codon:yes gene_type:complete
MVALKKLFEVTGAASDDGFQGDRVWLVLADHAEEAASLVPRLDSVKRVVSQPGLLTAHGPSRVIGWTIDQSAELAES